MTPTGVTRSDLEARERRAYRFGFLAGWCVAMAGVAMAELLIGCGKPVETHYFLGDSTDAVPVLSSPTTTVPPGDITVSKYTALVLSPTCRDIDTPTCVKALALNQPCYNLHVTYGRCDAAKCFLLESPLLDIEIVGKKFVVRPKDRAVRVEEEER